MHDNLQYKPRKELVLLCRQFGINTTDLKNEQLVTLLRIKLHQEIEDDSRVFGLSGRRAILNATDEHRSMAGSWGETEAVETSSLEQPQDGNASDEVSHPKYDAESQDATNSEEHWEEVAGSRSLDEIPPASEDSPSIDLSGAGDGSNFVKDHTATPESPTGTGSRSPDRTPHSVAPFLPAEVSTLVEDDSPRPSENADLGHTGVVGEEGPPGTVEEVKSILEEPARTVSGVEEEEAQDDDEGVDLNGVTSGARDFPVPLTEGSSFAVPPDLEQAEVQRPAVETSLPIVSEVTTTQDVEANQDTGEPETYHGGNGEDTVEAIPASSAVADDETSALRRVATADVLEQDEDAEAPGSRDEAPALSTLVGLLPDEDAFVAGGYQDSPVADSGEPQQKEDDSVEKGGVSSPHVSIQPTNEGMHAFDVAGVTGATDSTVGTERSPDESAQPVAEHAAELNAVNPPGHAGVIVKTSGAPEVSQDSNPAEDIPSAEGTPPSAQVSEESTLDVNLLPSDATPWDTRQEGSPTHKQSLVEGAEDSKTLKDDHQSGSIIKSTTAVDGTADPQDFQPASNGFSGAFYVGTEESYRQASASGDQVGATDVCAADSISDPTMVTSEEIGNNSSLPWSGQLETIGAPSDCVVETSGPTYRNVSGDEWVVATGQHENESAAVSDGHSGSMEEQSAPFTTGDEGVVATGQHANESVAVSDGHSGSMEEQSGSVTTGDYVVETSGPTYRDALASEPPVRSASGDEGVVATGQHANESTAVSDGHSGSMEEQSASVTTASGPEPATDHEETADVSPASGEPSREVEAVEEVVAPEEEEAETTAKDREGRPSNAVPTILGTSLVDKEFRATHGASGPNTLSISHDLPPEIIDVEKEFADLDEYECQSAAASDDDHEEVSVVERIPTAVANAATDASSVKLEKGGSASASASPTFPESTMPLRIPSGFEDRDKTVGWFNSLIQWFAQLCSPTQQR